MKLSMKSWVLIFVVMAIATVALGEPRQIFGHSTRICGLQKDVDITWDGSCDVEVYVKVIFYLN